MGEFEASSAFARVDFYVCSLRPPPEPRLRASNGADAVICDTAAITARSAAIAPTIIHASQGGEPNLCSLSDNSGMRHMQDTTAECRVPMGESIRADGQDTEDTWMGSSRGRGVGLVAPLGFGVKDSPEGRVLSLL